MKRLLVLALALTTTSGAVSVSTQGNDLRGLGTTVDALWTRFDRNQALEHVKFVSQYWRLPGNPGYDATIDRMRDRMVAAGFSADSSTTAPSLRIEEYPNTGKGWSYTVGTLGIRRDQQADEPVLTREAQNLSLAINSFSTPPDGITAPLLDVGRGRETDFAGKDVTGAVVIGDSDVGSLFTTASGHGAVGVVSTTLGSYINPDPPGAPATPRDQWNILQWGSIRYDETKKGFGFKATPKAAARLRAHIAEAKASGAPARVYVKVTSAFSDRPNRMLIAEIPGRTAPDERVVVTAHVQEPGANDNASGVATLAELATALAGAINAGAVARPERTITFLWLEEISGSRRWLTAHADQAKGVRYMFSMDMTGEDIKKTGGSFLIERWPDPGAVWERPWDPHSEWGSGSVRANQLKGDLLNDFHLAVCAQVATKSGWVVRSNPYEGGSDHSEFGRAGIPSLLNWHFTDRYYHSNYDTADKTSPDEMRNVGVAVATSAWFLASADEAQTIAVAELVAKAGRDRIAVEEREGQKLAAAATDQAAARTRETTIVAAWRKWYAEAVRSASRLIVGSASDALTKRIDALAAPFEAPPKTTSIASSLPRGAALAIHSVPADWSSSALAAETYPTEELLLAADRLLAARWFPAAAAASAPTPDERLLRDGLTSKTVAVRAAAVRSLGRFENALDLPTLTPFLNDAEVQVRIEAAQAVAQSMYRTRGAALAPAKTALADSLENEKTREVRAAKFEALARLKYDHETATQVAPLLAKAPSALVILMRQDRTLRPDTDIEARLRRLANPTVPVDAADLDPAEASRPAVDVARDALEALYLSGGVDAGLASWALAFNCAPGAVNCDGRAIRYLAVQQLDLKQPSLVAKLDALRHDPAYEVRIIALRKYAQTIATTLSCRPLLDTATDVSEITVVRLEAIGLLDARCTDKEDVRRVLTTMAAGLSQPELSLGARGVAPPGWHLPARAFEILVKFSPADARELLEHGGLTNRIWQVRVAATRVAMALKDEPALLKLAEDAEPNVRTEALNALVQTKSTFAARVALIDLQARDHQLIRAAALALRGTADPAAAIPAMWAALNRLTQVGADNSRDARLAIFDRLKELVRTPQGAPLVQQPFMLESLRALLRDFDPNVAAAAADTLAIVSGTRPAPDPTRRPVVQPTPAQLHALPVHATIVLEDGIAIPITLLSKEAPLAVARFVQLAGKGYFDHLTFHRIVPLFVIQGGSPGANEYVGDTRFMRDEIGLERHTRGAVGLSTRGRDTGDAQIFVDLTDQPRLNYEYTIFARVDPGATYTAPGRRPVEAISAVLEGATIARVTIR